MNGHPLTILLVEDNPDHAVLVMRNLEDFKVANKIIHVDDGQAALDYLYGQGEYADRLRFPIPNLILLDLRLPKVDGLEVLREVKENAELKSIPVVILTTSDAERDLVRAYEFGANSFLTKPVDFQEFTNLMRDLGFYWLAWNKRPW
ncbi:MAG: response regulator [Desulfuromonadales bacterium]|nr:response regulator [Desulfuromonadales bacterium]